MKLKLSFIILLNLITLFSLAQDTVAIFASKKDTGRYQRKTIAFPVLASAPETSLQLGAMVTHFFKLGNHHHITRTSYVQAIGSFTLKKQFQASINHHIFFDREKYVSTGNYTFSRFPENFYGVGNESPKDSQETVSYYSINISERLLRRVYRKLFIGVQYSFVRLFDVRFEAPDRFTSQTIYGKNGGNVSGLGPSIIWDNRSSVLNSFSGAYIELSAYFNDRSLGSDFNFESYILDVRKYYSLRNKKGVVALQAYGTFHTGHTPFRQLSMLGGSSIMRGYYAGRYRDNDLVAFQAEYRSPLVYKEKWGFVVFAAAGQVSPSPDKMNLNMFKPTYGGGLRRVLNKKENLNLRIDVAFGNNTSAVYLNIAEAF
ncbi:MAG TPA: BamA/TamA family outer membrane protein [Cytophagaceae bacterium]|jgi:hypothetical protein|nr:BamA/TamA family outer membrane protein [Cytophagaceae bacterium]